MTQLGSARLWRAFLIVAIGVFLSVLDLFIVNVAFPVLRRELPASSLAQLSWVLTAYAIVFAAAEVIHRGSGEAPEAVAVHHEEGFRHLGRAERPIGLVVGDCQVQGRRPGSMRP